MVKKFRLIRIIRVKIAWMHKNNIWVTVASIRILPGIMLILAAINEPDHDLTLPLNGRVYTISSHKISSYALYLGIILILSLFRHIPYIKPLYNTIFFPLRCLFTLTIYFIRYIYVPYINIIILLILIIIFNLFIPIKNNFLLLYIAIMGISMGAIHPPFKAFKKVRNLYYWMLKFWDLGFREFLRFKEEDNRIRNKKCVPYKVSERLNNIANTLWFDENEDSSAQSRKVIYLIYFLVISISGFLKFYIKDIEMHTELAEVSAQLNSLLPSFDVTCSAFITFLAYDSILQMKAYPTMAYFNKVFQRIKTIFKTFQ